jgi:dipeptidyl aminopeptidase/acylaminoacyl peptidase
MDSTLRDRLADLARDVPVEHSLPPRLRTRARRRTLLSVCSLLIGCLLVTVTAVAGVRTLLRSEERDLLDHPRPTNPEPRTDPWTDDIAGWITYMDQDGSAHVVDPETSETRELFPGEPGAIPIAWSHDGSHLLLWQRDRLIVEADTREQVSLMTRATGVWGGSWSPDDTRVVFAEAGRPQNKPISSIVIADSDGNGARTLLQVEHGNQSSLLFPAWSPDGTEIAFLWSNGPLGGVLTIMDADGSDARPLLASGRRSGLSPPVWSPDGSMLAFAGVEGFYSGIYTVNRDGTGLTRVADIEGAVSPAWSPDGQRIAFRMVPDDQLFVMNRDGSAIRSLGVFAVAWQESPILWRPGTN